jgi:pyridoxamine 5'-phosphate oxidase
VNFHLPPWRSPIARALHRNRSLPQSRYLQLATIDAHQRPRNRTLVFRGWLEPDSQLKFVTDLRSSKAIQLAARSHPPTPQFAEACWYFPKTREQFRVSGTLTLIAPGSEIDWHQQALQEAWQQMSASARHQFDWATPGADISPNPETFTPPIPDAIAPSVNFGLLLLKPIAIDHLELRGEPQNRYLYESTAGEWAVRQVNP